MTTWPGLLGLAFGLCLVQFLAAVPWLLAWSATAPLLRGSKEGLQRVAVRVLVAILVLTALSAAALFHQQDKDYLGALGRLYGLFLFFQLLLDFFVVAFGIMLKVWPRGAAVALAAFYESIRQPLFILLTFLALVWMLLMPFFPYFTFGEDLKFVKELGYDTIMLVGGLFAVLAASISISEEIEGRTAITLMSKPVSRRQFLLGKFTGILFASLLMTGIISLMFLLMIWFKPLYDKEDTIATVPWVDHAARSFSSFGDVAVYFLTGVFGWIGDAIAASPGLILGFCQIMVLLGIAVGLATRLPMVVNLVICGFVFFLGHLTPVLAQVSQNRFALIRFMAQLFDTLLPGLDFFNIGPALTRDTYPATGPFVIYIGSVTLYACLYTAIALLFGLILFEDRDLA